MLLTVLSFDPCFRRGQQETLMQESMTCEHALQVVMFFLGGAILVDPG